MHLPFMVSSHVKFCDIPSYVVRESDSELKVYIQLVVESEGTLRYANSSTKSSHCKINCNDITHRLLFPFMQASDLKTP